MQAPNALLKFIGKAALNAVGGGLAGDLVIDVLPEVAKDVWGWWGKKRTPKQRQADVEALVQAPPQEVQLAVAEVVEEVAAEEPIEVKQALAAYLTQVPGAIRRSLRRPADPTGRTVAPDQTARDADGLLPYLPTRLPRFKPGDRPLAGVDFELVELLGVGGFGEVWMARNPIVDSMAPVALKFCLDETAKDQLLRHEATVLNQVMREGTHDGIVPLQHTFLSGNLPCLAYEYVSGGDLTQIIRELHQGDDKDMGPIIRKSVQIIQELADVIAFAHSRKPPIVHRDLKPANVLVQRSAEGKVKLRIADFGIGGVVARQNAGPTRVGTTKGGYQHEVVRGSYTPLYASPEQMRGDPPDPRDDVHALGVIWYQILKGDLSAARPSGTKWTKWLDDQGMPEDQIELLASCFEDSPEDRPATASALAEQLREITGRKTKKPPKNQKPTLKLTEDEAKVFEHYAAAKAICEEAKEELDRHKDAAQELLWRKMLQLWVANKAKPENQVVKVSNGRVTGQVQIKETMKLDLPEDQDLRSTLLSAGFSRESVDRITRGEVEMEEETSLRTPSDLKKKPDLLEKIIKLLRKHLTPDEQAEAFKTTTEGVVKEGFLERALDYAGSEEELYKLLEIIKPTFTLASVSFKGDVEKAFKELHTLRDQAALQGAEVK